MSLNPMPLRRRAKACAALLSLTMLHLAGVAKPAPSPPGCGEAFNSYGPFDYRSAQPSQRLIVENAHFTPGVENLTRGATGPFGHDIGYTLAVFPNHPRAIAAMERLAERQKTDPPQGASMTIDCYYARGMNFAPDDLVFRMLYANSLIRRKRFDEAQRFLDYVVTQAGDNPMTHFNAGMLYMDMSRHDQALVQAHRAMALGLVRPELRDRLTAAGRWKEPEPTAAEATASSASAASQAPR
jgi:hypothetical protein